MCFTPFKRASAAPPAAFAAFPDVASSTEGYELKGALVIRADALWFFVKSCRRSRLGQVGGFQLGGLYARLLQAMLDLYADALGLGAAKRPEKLTFRPTPKVLMEFDAALAEAPLIASMPVCFCVEKGDIQELSLTAWKSTLALKTRWTDLSVSGVDPRDKATGALRRFAYPLKP